MTIRCGPGDGGFVIIISRWWSMPDSESQGPGETKSHVKAANRISLIYWRPGATKLSATSLGICPAIWSNIEKGVTRTLTVRITKVAPELSQILKWKYNISRELKRPYVRLYRQNVSCPSVQILWVSHNDGIARFYCLRGLEPLGFVGHAEPGRGSCRFPNCWSQWSADLVIINSRNLHPDLWSNKTQRQVPSSWLQTPALPVLPQSYHLTIRCLYTLKLPVHTNYKHRPHADNHVPHHSINTRHHCWNSKAHTPRYRHNRPRYFRYILSQNKERHVLESSLEVFFGRSNRTVWLGIDDSITKSIEERWYYRS